MFHYIEILFRINEIMLCWQFWGFVWHVYYLQYFQNKAITLQQNSQSVPKFPMQNTTLWLRHDQEKIEGHIQYLQSIFCPKIYLRDTILSFLVWALKQLLNSSVYLIQDVINRRLISKITNINICTLSRRFIVLATTVCLFYK